MSEQAQNGNGTGKAVAPIKPPLMVGNAGAILPRDVEQTYRLASIIKASDMAPKSFKNESQIMVAIMHGMEVGLTPMAALQSIAVINGMPTIWGDGALALVNATGQLEDMKETLEGTGDGLKAVCSLKRKGRPTPIVRSFSVGDAKQAGLWGKKGRDGQPTPWVTYPQRMLQMRARAWAMRDGFADALRGLAVAEEARDMGELYRAADGAYETAPAKPQRADFVPRDDATGDAPNMDAEYRQAVSGTIPDALEEMLDTPAHDPNTGELAPSRAVDWAAIAAGILDNVQSCETADDGNDAWKQSRQARTGMKEDAPEIYNDLFAKVTAHIQSLGNRSAE